MNAFHLEKCVPRNAVAVIARMSYKIMNKSKMCEVSVKTDVKIRNKNEVVTAKNHNVRKNIVNVLMRD